MSAYIRVDKDLVNDPRIGRLAEQLSQCMRVSWIRGGNDVVETGEDLTEVENRSALRNALLGSLVTLWWYADTHIRSDDTLPISVTALADVMGLPVAVVLALPGEWLMVREDGTVVLPGYVEKNILITKEIRREQTRQRVRNWRAARVTKSGNASVTPVTHPRARVRAPTRVRAPEPEPYTETKREEDTQEGVCANSHELEVSPEGVASDKGLDLTLAYPEGAEPVNALAVQREVSARLRAGNTLVEIVAGARRYARYCDALQRTGTQYVMALDRFIREKRFLQPWDPPPTKAEQRIVANVSAAEEFMRRTEPKP